MTANITTVKFRHYTDDDLIYLGEAEIEEDDTVSLIQVWEVGTTLEEIFPYETKFPVELRRELETAAIEARTTPPAQPVTLPPDWDGFEVEGIETTYTISAKLALPTVNSDQAAIMHGLSSVKRITCIDNKGKYRVTATGGLQDVRRELYKIRIF